MDQVAAISLVTVVGTLSAVTFGYAGYSRGLKKDSYAVGEEQGTLKSDVSYTRRRIDDVLLEQRDTNRNVTALTERVTRVEESTKSAHKRIDQIEEKAGV